VKRYLHDIEIAWEALTSNKLKSGLTALGILFGVAAVISMLAIGQGAKQEIIKQIELIGANNIIVEAKTEKSSSDTGNNDEEGNQEDQKNKQQKFSPGLNLEDYESIRNIVPTVQRTSPEIIMQSGLVYDGVSMDGNCIGVSNDYFDIYNFKLRRGSYFSALQEGAGKKVCIIGSDVASQLFSQENPIGKYLKFGNIWLKVIGVLQQESVSATAIQEYGFNRVNASIYIPDKTMIMRVKNRKLLNYKPSSSGGSVVVINGAVYGNRSGNDQNNYHQLDRIILKVDNTDHLGSTATLVKRMLKRRHNGLEDFEVIVPEILLRQKQQAKEIFNLVLGAIAGISLLVGGIGIMNIMFATVMERIREIGIRMAIGANKKDILVQFLTEAVLISLSGGFTGIALGFAISGMIEQLTEIETVVTAGSILIAFLVSVTVGIIFGYSPAKRAAEKDPIESLRYE
jgi:putative ABC transport system permease protein